MTRPPHLRAIMRPAGIQTGGWRHPGAAPGADFNFALLQALARRLEAAKFDAFLMADHVAVLNMHVDTLKRGHTVSSLEPFTLLSGSAASADRIGLMATASTTFDMASKAPLSGIGGMRRLRAADPRASA